MDQYVFLLVLLSAFIQASWNFLAKKFSGNKTAAICVGWFFLGIVFVPIAALVTDLSRLNETSVFLLLATGVIHSVYISFLGWAYTVGEISVVYPIARGLGIAGTAAITSLMGIDDLSLIGILGIFAIVTGGLLIAAKEVFAKKNTKSVLLAIAIGIIISSYTIVDKMAVETVPPFFLIAVMNLLPPLILAPILLTKYRKETTDILKYHKRQALVIGFGGSLAYVFILWAFQSTSAAYVVALRETSIIIASILGVIFLKEQLSKRKVLGIACIFIGSVLLRFV